jgi:hypothetical protein
VNNVIVQGVSDENQIADVLSIGRNFEAQCIFHGPHRGHGVHRRANPAETLGKDPAFAWIAAAQNGLNAAPHGAACPGLLHGAGFNFHVDAQVAFDACNGINGHSVCHS